MSVWDAELAKPQAEYPCLEFVRFVKRNEWADGYFLDIGSGGGANSNFLADNWFAVFAVDCSYKASLYLRETVAFFHADISKEWPFKVQFECILDHNTLCHVERPPFDKIHEALTPGGIFFMVAPTEDTCIRGELQRRSFTRFASEVEIRDMLKMFSQVWIGHSEYTDRKIGQQIKSYVVEATK